MVTAKFALKHPSTTELEALPAPHRNWLKSFFKWLKSWNDPVPFVIIPGVGIYGQPHKPKKKKRGR